MMILEVNWSPLLEVLSRFSRVVIREDCMGAVIRNVLYSTGRPMVSNLLHDRHKLPTSLFRGS